MECGFEWFRHNYEFPNFKKRIIVAHVQYIECAICLTLILKSAQARCARRWEQLEFFSCWSGLPIPKLYTKDILAYTHFWNSVFPVYENKVLQLMPAGASLERFGDKDLVFINWRLCRHCFKNQWTLSQILLLESNAENNWFIKALNVVIII